MIKLPSVENQHPDSEQQKRLRAARRVVIKLGTGIVTGSDGQFNAGASWAFRPRDRARERGRPSNRPRCPLVLSAWAEADWAHRDRAERPRDSSGVRCGRTEPADARVRKVISGTRRPTCASVLGLPRGISSIENRIKPCGRRGSAF